MKSWKYILIVVFCVLCGVFIAEILNGIQKPVYRSHGLMEIKTRAPWKGLTDGQYRMIVNEIIATECKKIISYPIIKEAADSLGIIPVNSSNEDKNRILRYLQKHISAGRIKGTNIIQITASYNNPKWVAHIINNILGIYIRKKTEAKENFYAEEQFDKVKKILNKDKEKLRILSEKQGFINNSELLEAKLVDLKLDFTKLSRKYSERHPQIIDLKEQIKVTENQLSLSSKREQLIKKIEINEELYNTFNNIRLNEADMVGKLSIIAPAIEPILPIKPKKEFNLSAGGLIGFLFGLFLSFRTRSKEISLKDIEKIETNFEIPVIGIIPRIKDMAKANLSFWNLKPTKKTDELVELRNRLLLYYSTKSAVTEAYYTLWANIKFALQEKQGRALLFTSADSKEGKTLTAVNYAIANAMAGIKTLLVEADSIKPLIYKIFNLPKEPGLREIILKDMNWKGMLKDTSSFFNTSSLKSRNLDCLKIITYGKESNTPIDILTSKKIEKFIEEVKQEFGLVIFDCSPLLLSAEPVILSGKVDDVILVYRSGKVQLGLLNRAKIQLENIRANILGIVLNNIKTSEIYPHYAYYPGKYLGKSEAKQEKVPVKQRTKRVLIIDDESNIVNVITRMLLKKSKFKYEVASASDGITALKQLDLFNPHLVILDLKLPGIDGFQICKKIRSDLQKKNMKILAITGYDDPDTKERILSYGADEYLTKPFDINKFMECVDKLPG